MKIAHREISENHHPLVIAEIGINHGGDLGVAKEMVRLAGEAGCECIKHQTHFVEDEMTEEAKEVVPPNSDRSIWEIMEACALTQDEERELKEHCEGLGMVYLSTPFSRKAANFLDEIGVPAFKIGSGESDNLPLIKHICSFGKPVIMSTGMQTIETIGRSVGILEKAGVEHALLECTNLYPSPPETVSLQGVVELRKAFPNVAVGFSDHSIGPQMALASVALGACIIERHFTDSRYRKGPDISCSMDPAELKYLIDRSREIHTALRNPKRRSEPEHDVYLFARGSLVADRDLKKGQVIAEQDIWARRPGTGEIPAYHFDAAIGRTLTRDLKFNEQLRWTDIDLDPADV